MRRHSLTFLLIMILAMATGLGTVTAQDDELTTHQGEAFYIQTPGNWLNLNDPELLATTMSEIVAENPQFQNSLASILPQIEAGLFDLYILDPLGVANINVIATDIGVTLELDVLVEESLKQYEILGATVLEIMPVTLPVAEAVQLHITLPVQAGGEQVLTEQYQYIFMQGTVFYVISMGAQQPLFLQYEPIFTTAIQSFGLGQAPVQVVSSGGMGQAPTTNDNTGMMQPAATSEVSSVDSPIDDTTKHISERISISTPNNWFNVADQDLLTEYITLAAEANPNFEAAAQIAFEQLEAGAFELFLLDALTGANVNVLVQELGVDVEPSFFEQSLTTTYQDLELQLIGSQLITLPGGDALRFDMISPFEMELSGENRDQRQEQYIFTANQSLYVVTMTVPIEQYETFAPVFQEIIQTFNILQ